MRGVGIGMYGSQYGMAFCSCSIFLKYSICVRHLELMLRLPWFLEG